MDPHIWVAPNSQCPSCKSSIGTPLRVWASATLSADNLSISTLPEQVPKKPNCKKPNPFEREIERWHLPTISPSAFLHAPSEQTNEPFCWSIDELAVLKPAEIEENTSDVESPQQDEQHVQEAIDIFFSQKQVVPSPWLTSNVNKDSHSSNLKYQDAACQTMLSLPLNFPLDQLLGNYYNCIKDEVEDSPDVLSVSTLRRKLFFQGDIGSSPSPVKSEKTWLTRMQCDESPCKSSPSMLFSSSPVVNIKVCRSSVSPMNTVSSPLLSPIAVKKHQTVNDDQVNQCLLMLGTRRLALSEIRDNSMMELTSMESQDTGYQTGSLQTQEELQTTDKLCSQTNIYYHTPPKLLSTTPQKKRTYEAF